VEAVQEMPDGQTATVFVIAALVLLITPGPAVLYIVTRSIVDPSKGAVGAQILFLGAIFVALGTCTDGLYAVLAGTMGHWLRGNMRFVRAQRYVAGSVYIGLGVTAALSGAQEGP
jgi:threonine/homoserine/homoserine lactone efflux protein